jgi:hypothetical protein
LEVALTEEERAVIIKHVTNNLRQLDSASQQYYLEHGLNEVTFDLLVGEGPDRYIRQLKAADGEDYTKLVFKQRDGPAEWVIKTARGVEVRHTRD